MSQNTITAEQALKLAKANEKKGDIEGAKHLYQMVLASFPQNKRAKKGLNRLQKTISKSKSPSNLTQQQINELDRLRCNGNRTAAINQTKALIQDHPNVSLLHNFLGVCYFDIGQYNLAVISYGKAIKIRPDNVEAHNNLGIVFGRLNQHAAAVASYKHALEIKPDYAEAHNNLGVILKNVGQIDKAIACFEQVIRINSKFPEAYDNLGIALHTYGRLDEAVVAFRQALDLRPDSEDTFGNLLFSLNYAPDLSAEQIYSAYQEYDMQFCLPHRNQWRAHTNSRVPERRLKIGYISPDFSSHSMRHFLEPLLDNHNHEEFEVIAYAEMLREDIVTSRYRNYVDSWVRTNGLSDEFLAEQIRKDGVDILIDLAGHTQNNRLGVMARKPAPVSVSTLGYGYTTGLTAIDYFMIDQVSAPPDYEHLFSETLCRLQTPGFAYRPAEDMGEINPLPALERGFVTFGTLTRAVRINHHTIRVWSKILKQVKGAHLVINSRDFTCPEMKKQLVEQFTAEGIDSACLEIGFESPPWDVMRGIDIGLDCFPHNSGTTLFEHLYMGVPFITLAGRPSVGRIGASILEGIEIPDWIATSEDEYVEKAVALASDISALAATRSGLRKQMQSSAIMDEPGYARKVEAAYRQMWQRWCDDHTLE